MLPMLNKPKEHYKSKEVLEYFDEYKQNLIPVYFPNWSPEFMVLEQIWEYTQKRSSCPTELFILPRLDN